MRNFYKTAIFSILAIAIVVVLGFSGCKTTNPFKDTKKNPVGEKYYTTANIWYEHPQEIYSTNYHVGEMVPAGTKVRILNVTTRKIVFHEIKTKDKFTLVYVKRHSSINIKKYFYRYFTKTDPMGKNGKFNNFTNKEKTNIKKGKIASGMSKDAVIMAYGYPPSHKTRNLDESKWRYWINRFNTKLVKFNDKGKVTKVVD